jgi:hypothetical protein
LRNLINARADINIPSAFGLTPLYEGIHFVIKFTV